MARQKTADLRIRAKDESSAVLRKAKGALDAFNAAAQKSASRRAVLGARRKEIEDVRQSYVRLTADMRRLQEAQDRMRASGTASQSMLRENGEAIGLLRARAREAVDTLARKRAEVQRLGTATQNSFAAFSRSADAMRRQSGAAQEGAAANRTQSVTAKQNADELGRLARRSTEAARAQTQLRGQTIQTTSAMVAQNSAMRGRAARQNWGSPVKGEDQELFAFGLRPYQLTNLSYQVNDVVSGFAMGQRPMQIFAQQAGQIIQIFPAFARGMMGIFRFLENYYKLILPVVGVLGVLFTTMYRDAQEAGVIQQFATELTILADGGNYTAESLAAVVREARNMGMALGDAQSAVSTFVRAGFNQSRIPEMVEMSRQLAEVTGTDVPEAAQKLATAFSGGIDGIRELDKEMNFLTASQYAMIRGLEDSGRETEALELATQILTNTLEDASTKASGPWSQAFRNVGDAWDYALEWFGNTAPIQAAIGAINALGTAVAFLTSLLPGAGAGGSISASQRFESLSEVQHSEMQVYYREQIKLAEDFWRDLAKTQSDDPLEIELEFNLLRSDDSRIQEWERLISEHIEAAEKSVLSNPRFRNQIEIPVDIVPEVQQEPLLGGMTNAEANNRLDAEREINRVQADRTRELERQAELSTLSSREQFVQREMDRIRAAAAEKNITDNELNLELLEAQAGATYDALEAERERNRSARGGGGAGKDPIAEERKRLEQEMNDILELRKELLEEIAFQESQGNTEAVERLKQQLDGVNDSARLAIDNLITFLETLSGPGIEAAIISLRRIRRELGDIGTEALFTADQINESLASKGANAFDKFAQSLANGENAIKSLRDAFLQFAADFLREIAQMIIQQALLNALKGAFGGAGGGVGGAIAGALNAIVKHNGGMANSGGGSRSVNPAVFAGAARFHGGGIAGLGPREVPAILMDDEEVLTAQDPRHARNGGTASPTLNVKNVNVFDASDMLDKALSSSVGEKVLMNFISRNARQVKGALG